MLSSAISYASCKEKKGNRGQGGGGCGREKKGSESGNGGRASVGRISGPQWDRQKLAWGEQRGNGVLDGADFFGDVDVSRCESGSREGRLPCTHLLTAARLGGSAAVWSLIARQEGGMGREVEEEEEEEEESGGWLQ